MASRTIFTRSAGALRQTESCISCLHSQRRPALCNGPLTLPSRTAKARIAFSRETVGTSTRITPEQARTEIDTRARLEFYAKLREMKVLPIMGEAAEKIVNDFLSSDIKDPAAKVIELAKSYNMPLLDLTKVAWAIYRTPPIPEPKRLPPSENPKIAASLFQGLSLAKEPAAILYVLRAAHTSHLYPASAKLAGTFSALHLRECRKVLEELALERKNVEAMTLLGLFLWKEGSTQGARTLFEEALALEKFDRDPKQPLSEIPQLECWNALGLLLLRVKHELNHASLERIKALVSPEQAKLQPEMQQAKEAFQKGALQGDDPLSYYILALMTEKNTADWLRYMTKAAGSALLDAMYEVGSFYQMIDAQSPADLRSMLAKDKTLSKALHWLRFRTNSARTLATEWFLAAATAGHKPSMLKIVDLDTNIEDHEAETWLSLIAESPPQGQVENYPHLIPEAKRRLHELKTRPKPKMA